MQLEKLTRENTRLLKALGGKAMSKKFQELKNKIKREYIKKGYSPATAERYAEATAGKIFWEHYGKKKGRKVLKKAR